MDTKKPAVPAEEAGFLFQNSRRMVYIEKSDGRVTLARVDQVKPVSQEQQCKETTLNEVAQNEVQYEAIKKLDDIQCEKEGYQTDEDILKRSMKRWRSFGGHVVIVKPKECYKYILHCITGGGYA